LEYEDRFTEFYRLLEEHRVWSESTVKVPTAAHAGKAMAWNVTVVNTLAESSPRPLPVQAAQHSMPRLRFRRNTHLSHPNIFQPLALENLLGPINAPGILFLTVLRLRSAPPVISEDTSKTMHIFQRNIRCAKFLT